MRSEPLRYLHGWSMWVRALRMARRKKHGAGRQSWRNALRQAACDRWIVDGQLRGGNLPRYLRPFGKGRRSGAWGDRETER